MIAVGKKRLAGVERYFVARPINAIAQTVGDKNATIGGKADNVSGVCAEVGVMLSNERILLCGG